MKFMYYFDEHGNEVISFPPMLQINKVGIVFSI